MQETAIPTTSGTTTGRHILSVREKTRPYFAGWVDHLTPYFCSDPRFAKKYMYRLTNEHDRNRLIFLGYEVMEEIV
jgi:hypothetical protein